MTTHASISFRCDECGGQFAPADGGLCATCQRMLCWRHLYGWFGGWRRFMGREAVCVHCRERQGGGASAVNAGPGGAK